MKLSQEIKRMFNAMAYANAGDYLSPSQKSRALADVPAAPPQPRATATASDAPRPQVGLYVGSELSADVMQYVAQTCSRLRHGLTVLSFQNAEDVEALLAPHRPLLETAGVELRLVIVAGEPPAGLAQALRRRPEIAILVCNESGYLGHGLLNGTQQSALPVPVVLVAANDVAIAATEPATTVRAA